MKQSNRKWKNMIKLVKGGTSMQDPLIEKIIEVGSVEDFVKCITFFLSINFEYDKYLRRKEFLYSKY